MAQVIVGLIHTRGLHILAVVLVLCLTGLWFGWDAHYAVQPSFEKMGRGIPSFEMVSILLASIIPIITMTRLESWERLEMPFPRVVNTAVTILCAFLPTVTLPVWLLAVGYYSPTDEFPSTWGYVGTILLIAAIGQLWFWLGGAVVTLVATPATWILVIYFQQLYPETYPFRGIAHGYQWETHWSIIALAATMIIAVSWFGYSLPRRIR